MAMGVPPTRWFTEENPFKIDDLVVPHFRKPRYGKEMGNLK